MVATIQGLMTKFEGIRSVGANTQVTYRDKGAKKISEQLDILANLALTVGYQGATALTLYSDGKINVATVALLNEFGTQNMPARPFMRRAITENLGEIKQEFATNFAAVVELRKTAIQAMDDVGRFVAEKMVDAIDTASTWAAPLAPSTVEGKGHAAPLFETGLMKESITWAVRKGSARGAIVREGKV